MKRVSWIYPVIGLVIGLIAWGNNPAFMPVSLLILPAWFHARSRFFAGLTVVLYLAAASRDLPMATMNYFQASLARSSVDWLFGVALAALPFFIFYFKNREWRLIGAVIALALAAIPPFGITFWSHPLASTGVWWPGGGWLALGFTLLLVPLFCRFPLLVSLPIVLGLFPLPSLPVPDGWQALNTNFAGTAGQANSFVPLTVKDFTDDFIKQSKTIDRINDTIDSKNKKIVLLPESSGGTWFAGNDQLWQSRLTFPGTALVGATVPAGEYRDSVILAVSHTGSKTVYRQRQPVPVSMWWPGRKNSYLAHWFDNPVVTLQDHRVAFFVCYEQFLTWPVLQSLWHQPDILCATSSVWWATGTNIANIQQNIIRSWSTLFSVPLLTAINT